jgi:predicted nucleotidyltransferase
MPDFKSLAENLADWAAPTNFTIYLFGSRVRGDHRPDSDVDVVIEFGHQVTDADVEWWSENNREAFASINAVLPGRLEITERNSKLAHDVIASATNPVYRDRNVICVWFPPKS